MMNNIIEHPAVTAEKVESLWNVAGSELNLGEIHAGLSLEHYAKAGAALASLRDQNPQNVKFGVACAEHEIFLKPQMRAAVIWWGRLSDDQRESLTSVFPASESVVSLQDRCREWNPQWLKFEKSVIRSTDNVDTKITVSVKPPETPDIAPEPMKTEDQTSKKPEKKLITKRKATPKNVLCEHYTTQGWERICNHLPKPSDRKLLAAAVSSGALGGSNPIKNNGHNFGIREIFYNYPLRWRYQGMFGASLIRRLDEIIEHHTRCGEDLSKENCNKLAEEIRLEKIPTVVKSIYTAPAEPSGISHSDAKPANVQDIVVAGVLIWSETETKGHLYEDAWNTYQIFTRMVNDTPHDARHHWIRGSKSLGKFMHNVSLNSSCDVWTRMATAAINDLVKYVDDTHGAEPETNHAT